MKKVVSVIIPCYNAEVYLETCFASLEGQTIGMSQLELIFVDDGSTDQTWNILKKLERQYPESVLVIHCDTTGKQGTARNIGLQYATADYIGFVDADDWVEADMYEVLYAKMTEFDCDVVFCRNWRDRELDTPNLSPKCNGQEDRLLDITTAVQRKEFIVSNLVGYNVWDKLFRKDFLQQNHIYFPENIVYEDILFGSLVYLYARRIYILEQRLYHYRVNQASTVLCKNQNYHFDMLRVNELKWEEYQRREVLSEYNKELEFDFLMTGYFAGLKMLCLRFDEFPFEVFLLIKKSVLRCAPNYQDNPYISTHVSEFYKIMLNLLRIQVNSEDMKIIAEQFRKSF